MKTTLRSYGLASGLLILTAWSVLGCHPTTANNASGNNMATHPTQLDNSTGITGTQRPNNALISQIMIKLKAGMDGKPQPLTASLLQSLASTAGVSLAYVRPLAGDAHVLQVANPMSVQDLTAITTKLSQHPSVQYAEPDRIMTAQ